MSPAKGAAGDKAAKKDKKEKKKKDEDKKGKKDKSPEKKGKKDKDEKKKGKKDDGEKKGKKGKGDEPKGKKDKHEGDKKKKKGGDAGDEKKGKKKKKKKIPKFEDIMADVEAAKGPDVDAAQPELTMEPEVKEKEPEEQDVEMTTNVPAPEEGAGFSAVRPRTSRTHRPSSSRPAAPRPKMRGAIDLEAEETAGPGAVAVPQVMFDEEDDDDDNFIVEEKKLAPDPGLAAMMKEEENLAEQAEDGEHGLLVSQILDTKKSMEDEIKGKTEIEKDSGADKGKSRDKEAVKKEVLKLREAIQKVTKSANPLGKMMDFLQEDVDSMQRELDKWKDETKDVTQQIQHEVATTNDLIAPLHAALSEYEQSIIDQMDKISSARATVLENEQRIFHLMVGVMKVAALAQ